MSDTQQEAADPDRITPEQFVLALNFMWEIKTLSLFFLICQGEEQLLLRLQSDMMQTDGERRQHRGKLFGLWPSVHHVMHFK